MAKKCQLPPVASRRTLRKQASATMRNHQNYPASVASGLPENVGDDIADDVSSLNTSVFNQSTLRILGMEEEDFVVHRMEPSLADRRPPSKDTSPTVSNHSQSSPEMLVATPPKRSKKPSRVQVEPMPPRRRPRWLHIFVCGSIGLFCIALILLGVGVLLAVQQERNDQSSNAAQAPVHLRPPVLEPSVRRNSTSTTNNNLRTTSAPTTSPTVYPTAVPTTSPTFLPTLTPTTFPTSTPSDAIDSNLLMIHVTAGNFDERQDLVQSRLQHIPQRNGYAFLVQLGDDDSRNCTEQQELIDFYKVASVPTYFVLAGNDDECEEEQSTSLVQPTFFNPWPVVMRDSRFLFTYQHALFASVTLTAEDATEDRKNRNFRWIEDAYWEYRKDVDLLVIFANAAPDDGNIGFYTLLWEHVVDEFDHMHFCVVHPTGATTFAGLRRRYHGIANLDTVSVLSSVWPPLELVVDLHPDAERLVALDFGK